MCLWRTGPAAMPIVKINTHKQTDTAEYKLQARNKKRLQTRARRSVNSYILLLCLHRSFLLHSARTIEFEENLEYKFRSIWEWKRVNSSWTWYTTRRPTRHLLRISAQVFTIYIRKPTPARRSYEIKLRCIQWKATTWGAQAQLARTWGWGPGEWARESHQGKPAMQISRK